MRISAIYFLKSVISVFILTTVTLFFAESVYGTTFKFSPTVFELFTSIFLGPGSIALIVPIYLGLILHRRFLAIWNPVVVMVLLTATQLILTILIGLDGISAHFFLFFLNILISLFFTLFAFIVATIRAFQKKTTQFDGAPFFLKIVTMLLVYSILFPAVFVNTLFGIVGIGIIVILLYWIYRKVKSMPLSNKKSIYARSDYMYFYIILSVFLIALFFSQSVQLD